ncbi:MAG: hypothetical protein K8H88_17990 [Sandaracinaceae bacterium]|nr:hypothetical protein [Sandaracinaceae bacterium]
MSATMKLAIAISFLGLAACGGGGGTDAGTDAGPSDAGPMDAGPDGGPPMIDAGPDGGPPPMFQVRLANNIPGFSSASGFGLDVCFWGSIADDTVVPGTTEWLTQTIGPVPFRGVSPYRERVLVAALRYVIGLYDPAVIRPAGCPANPYDAAAPDPVLLEVVNGATLSVGARYSAIATGLAPDTLGATGGAFPSVCGAPPTFGAPCAGTVAPRLLLVEDDATAPASGMARLRVSNQVANLPVGFNVCYDPSLVPMAGNPACSDTNPADTPETLFPNVTYGTVTEYAERAPIEPTITAMGIGGGIYLVPETGTAGCPAYDAAMFGGCLPILAAFPTPPGADNIQPSLSDGDIDTIFIQGVAGQPANPDATMDVSVKLFFWQDNFVATP